MRIRKIIPSSHPLTDEVGKYPRTSDPNWQPILVSSDKGQTVVIQTNRLIMQRLERFVELIPRYLFRHR